MSEGVNGSGKITLGFQLCPVLPHAVLFSLASVWAAEDPFRLQVSIFVSFDGLADDGAGELSDRDHSAAIFVLSLSYMAASVYCSVNIDSILFDVIELETEDLSGPESGQDTETKGGMIPEP